MAPREQRVVAEAPLGVGSGPADVEIGIHLEGLASLLAFGDPQLLAGHSATLRHCRRRWSRGRVETLLGGPVPAYTYRVRPCPKCGEGAPEGARFCSACGAVLASGTQAGEERRKVVTIVFCDLAGSTSLGERLDPESVRRIITRYFDAMREALERHGGTVEKFIGDAVMAVFGVPTVREDDALRAVRAAAEVGDALRELNVE